MAMGPALLQRRRSVRDCTISEHPIKETPSKPGVTRVMEYL